MLGRVSGFITYSASGAAILGGLTLNDWAAVIGSVVAIAAFAHNVMHKRELRKIARANCTLPIEED
jgi:hypothetical protein